MSPSTVLHYRRRADRFLRAAGDLATLDSGDYAPAIGLLSVHSCIALADAVLVAVEGRRTKAEDHAEAARRLRDWCGAKRLADGGLKHLEWLLRRKNDFSYNDDVLQAAAVLLVERDAGRAEGVVADGGGKSGVLAAALIWDASS